ncbi:hypothetical protein AMATHDRAFT_42800 [Amanita thiersii Skay4041]|uniref:DUF6533 domain-containing protein n=1 Tax=Amanita thiersii Skay4041 TaxID=703135 RepID=A0A2A9NIW1_9AGAR|nr:hypothetical protein AMATHDRAFT_42800 [Amanita thiersii Skay4041]
MRDINNHRIQELKTVSKSSVASFVFILYDILLTLDDEVEIIWTKPRKSWVKWQFLFMRYFALAIQLSNLAIELRISLFEDYKLRRTALHDWFVAQVVVCFLLSSVVELMLMVRVYALYSRNLMIAGGFALLLLAQLVSMFVGIGTNVGSNGDIRGVGHRHDHHTYINPDSYPYFGVAAIVSQITIVVLTVAKHVKAIHLGLSSSILTLILRDGILTFIALICDNILCHSGGDDHE